MEETKRAWFSIWTGNRFGKQNGPLGPTRRIFLHLRAPRLLQQRHIVLNFYFLNFPNGVLTWVLRIRLEPRSQSVCGAPKIFIFVPPIFFRVGFSSPWPPDTTWHHLTPPDTTWRSWQAHKILRHAAGSGRIDSRRSRSRSRRSRSRRRNRERSRSPKRPGGYWMWMMLGATLCLDRKISEVTESN